MIGAAVPLKSGLAACFMGFGKGRKNFLKKILIFLFFAFGKGNLCVVLYLGNLFLFLKGILRSLNFYVFYLFYFYRTFGTEV